MTNDAFLYWYKCEFRSAYDADTVRVDIDLGCNVWSRNTSVRLARVNAWEVRGVDRRKGLIARDWLREQLGNGSLLVLNTSKDKTGKFGRLIADFYIGDVCVNDELVSVGHAKYQRY